MTLVSRFFLVFIILTSCNTNYRTYSISGYTQGTTYNIKYHTNDLLVSKKSIDSLFSIIDNSMSSYISNSNISKINSNKTNSLDSMIAYVIKSSIKICNETNGMFDITVFPIVRDWGFGPKSNFKNNISKNYNVGCEKIKIESGKIIKENDVMIDLNGIAQGFSVDYISKYLLSKNINDFMIEVGGEVKCSGNNLGARWKIGVQSPNSKNKDFAYILSLNNFSAATSGSYRNYYFKDNKKITHTMNPKTMRPVNSQVLSATIIHDECMFADAYATACMAFSIDESKRFLEDNEIAGSLLYLSEKDTISFFSKKFNQFLHSFPGSAPQ